MQLNPVEAYLLACALVGKDTPPLEGVSPAVQIVVNLLKIHKLGFNHLRDFLPDESLRQQILSIDPHSEPPTLTPPGQKSTIPALPANVQLKPEQIQQAGQTGQWLASYVEAVGKIANQTPISFHQGAALWLAALTIGRRVKINTPWGQTVYPNFYIMNIAPSTYYRKSTGFNLAQKIVRENLPYMVMSEPGSPEAFLNMLSGRLPSNFEELQTRDKDRLMKSQQYAAQRGLIRDELSGLFKAMQRDYMAGMKEHLMQFYDCPPFYDIQTLTKGLVVIRNVALSIIGATTPAELSLSLSVSDWLNGNLARFILLVPEVDYKERPSMDITAIPETLISEWLQVYHALPEPPKPSATEGGESVEQEEWALAVQGKFWHYVKAYEQALRHMTHPESGLDARLAASYGRLHVQALKLALVLAVYDWNKAGRVNYPILTETHWFYAQHQAEQWRVSLHRTLDELSLTKEAQIEQRVLSLLKRSSNGLTRRDIARTIHAETKQVADILDGLINDGLVLAKEGYQGKSPITLFVLDKDDPHVIH